MKMALFLLSAAGLLNATLIPIQQPDTAYLPAPRYWRSPIPSNR